MNTSPLSTPQPAHHAQAALQSDGQSSSRALGMLFDGIARHTQEGYDFVARSKEAGFRQACGRPRPILTLFSWILTSSTSPRDHTP